MDGNISFDGNSLQTFDKLTNTGIVTNAIDHSDIPDKNINLYELAGSDSSAISSINYPSKNIRIAGVIAVGSDISSGSTREEMLDELIDTFKGYFRGKNKNLDINYNGTTRRYKATANAVTINRTGTKTFAEFEVTFICVEPFGRDTTATTLIDDGTLGIDGTSRTGSNYNDDVTFGGSAAVQCPVITITLNSVTDGDGSYIMVGNAATGQQIIVQADWQDDDVLEIDTYNRTVKINGVEASFTGAFPVFEPGDQVLTYADSFTARDFDIGVDYYKLYL